MKLTHINATGRVTKEPRYYDDQWFVLRDDGKLVSISEALKHSEGKRVVVTIAEVEE